MISTHVGLGKVCVLGQDTAINQDLKAVIPVGDLSRWYLYYWFLSKADLLVANGKGATVKGVTVDFVKSLKIDIPSLKRQTEVVAALNAAQDLIDNSENQLAKLDQLVKSRFVEIFGDGGNWQPCAMKDMCELITDGEHATPRRVDHGTYLLSARNVHDHRIVLDEVDYIDEEEYNRIARRVVPRAGDLLLSCSGSVGRCCVVPAGLRFQLVRSVALLRLKDGVLPKFAEYLLCSSLLQRQIDKLKTASSQANLFQGKIKKLLGFVPPLALQREFAAFVAEVDKSKFAVRKRLEKARQLYRAKLQECFG